MPDYDFIFVGGGLQSGLAALALIKTKACPRVLVLEQGATLGGNHTWSFHQDDVPQAHMSLVEPLIEARWTSYIVKFPQVSRVVPLRYYTTTSARLHAVLAHAARRSQQLELRLGETARTVSHSCVETGAGTLLRGRVVIDATGPQQLQQSNTIGYQKFVGLECELSTEITHTVPVLMDATVDQVGGFRFLYVLPLANRRVLMEDTYYSDTPELDVPALRSGILEYATGQGLAVERITREEIGVLPLPRRAPVTVSADSDIGPIRGGFRGGWFHPTTGYSFPVALRFAIALAASAESELRPDFSKLADTVRQQQRFCTLLNRLLFDGFEPTARRQVFERFYGLPVDTISRFYSMQLQSTDKLRILCGRPPRGMSHRRFLVNTFARADVSISQEARP